MGNAEVQLKPRLIFIRWTETPQVLQLGLALIGSIRVREIRVNEIRVRDFRVKASQGQGQGQTQGFKYVSFILSRQCIRKIVFSRVPADNVLSKNNSQLTMLAYSGVALSQSSTKLCTLIWFVMSILHMNLTFQQYIQLQLHRIQGVKTMSRTSACCVQSNIHGLGNVH